MSDDGYFGPAGPPPPSGDTATIEEAVREQRERRAIAEVSGDLATPEPEPTEPAPTKLRDDGTDPLSVRKGARLLTRLRQDEAARRAAYAANADAAIREIDRLAAGSGPSEQARAETVKQAAAELAGSFSDLQTAEDVRRLQEQDPSRYARYAHLDGLIRGNVPAQRQGQQSDADPLQAERAQIEAERQHYAQERAAQQQLAGLSSTEAQLWQAEQELGQRIVSATNEFNSIFADVTSVQALQLLQQQNPERFAQFQQHYGTLQAAAQQLEQFQAQRGAVAQQRAAVGSTEFQRLAALHDQAFEAEHPELTRDPAKFRQVQEAARDYLIEKGLSEEELKAHWSGMKSFSLREKISQDILLDATRWRMAQDRLQESRTNSRQLPPVQKPGTRQDRSESLHAEAEKASRALDRTGHVKDAVRLMQAQRRLGARR